MSGPAAPPDPVDGSASPPAAVANAQGDPAATRPADELPGTVADLAALRCRHETTRLSPDALARLAILLPEWTVCGANLSRRFDFSDFHQTMAFVNALAWIAHRQDHHPDLAVGYNRCEVSFSTHSAGGLTRNDFICAARVEALTWQE